MEDPAQAERQKERLAAKRMEEAAQGLQDTEEAPEQESETEIQQDEGFTMQMF